MCPASAPLRLGASTALYLGGTGVALGRRPSQRPLPWPGPRGEHGAQGGADLRKENSFLCSCVFVCRFPGHVFCVLGTEMASWETVTGKGLTGLVGVSLRLSKWTPALRPPSLREGCTGRCPYLWAASHLGVEFPCILYSSFLGVASRFNLQNLIKVKYRFFGRVIFRCFDQLWIPLEFWGTG